MTSVSFAPRGQDFARIVRIWCLAKGRVSDAQLIAAERYGQPEVRDIFTKAVPGTISTGSGTWGAQLTDSGAAGVEFIAAVQERSVLGRMPGSRKVPLATRIVTVDDGAQADWVDESAQKPTAELIFSRVTLEPLKIASMVIITDELARSSDPAAEGVIRADLARAAGAALDLALLDPSNTGTPGTKPASITAGAPTTAASGNIPDDLAALLELFEGDLETASFVARGATFAALSGTAHPNVGLRGGELLGLPAIASRHAPAGALIIADAQRVVHGTGRIAIMVGRETTIDVGGGTMLNLWQQNCTAIRADLQCNWQAGPGASALLTDVVGGS